MTPGFLKPLHRRVFGRFAFVDTITGNRISSPLSVISPQLQLMANDSGLFAIFSGPSFGQFTKQWPTAQMFEIAVRDPNHRYLPRRAQIRAAGLVEVFTLQQVPLYRSPKSPVEPDWAVVRASIRSDWAPLAWAVVQVLSSDQSVLATGVSDARGEALLAVRNLGTDVSDHMTGVVKNATTDVTIQAWFDPTVMGRASDWIPNPDDMSRNLGNPTFKSVARRGVLRAGQTLSVVLEFPFM